MNDSTVIAIFCYKRAAKLKTCIEALLKNPECADLEIIFFSDGYKNENDMDGVLETRAYIDSIRGFKKIHKCFRERNFSTGPNFKEGITFLCNNYEQFIVVEDDLVVSPNYLRYMLQALSFYKGEKSVFCITGYCFPLDVNNYAFDTVMCKRFCAYGWAAWSSQVKHVNWDMVALDRLIKTSPGFKRRLNSEGHDLMRTLRKQISGAISTWDIQFQVHVAENNLRVVYPIVSKVKNIGFDTESTNTFGIDYLKTPVDEGEKKHFKFCQANSVEPLIQNQIKKPYALKALVTRKIINTFIKVTSQARKAYQ